MMTEKQEQHLYELALIRSILACTTGTLEEGRLKNQYNRLEKETTKALRSFPQISTDDVKKAEKILNDFGKLTGWQHKERHVATLVSFALEIIEKSEFIYSQKTVDALVNIHDYYDRVGDVMPICHRAGEIAWEKWQQVLAQNSVPLDEGERAREVCGS